MGRFWRAPVHVQQPQVLNLRLSDPTRKMRIKDLRVSHVDMNFVFRVLFILTLCFKYELFQDVVITCDDATDSVW